MNSRFTELRFWRVAALLLAGLLLAACRGTPATTPAPKADDRGRALQEIADFALWVRQQSDATLGEELTKLERGPDAAAGWLRIALITGQRQSALHDPERTARLLARVAAEEPAASVHAQLAQALLAVLPLEARHCGAQECEEKLSTLVQVEELRRRELTTRIEALRGQLESERNQREKLESQLEALKSLEAQIKNRDGPQ